MGTPFFVGSTNGSFSTANNGNISLTTTANGWVIATIFGEVQTTSGTYPLQVANVTATGLSFTRRSQILGSVGGDKGWWGNSFNTLECWYAPASAQTAVSINVKFNQTIDCSSIVAAGVAPNVSTLPLAWDINSSLPTVGTSTLVNTTAANSSIVGVSTTSANSLIFTVQGVQGDSTGTVVPWVPTSIGGVTATQLNWNCDTSGAFESTIGLEYVPFTTAQTSITCLYHNNSNGVSGTVTANTVYYMYADAITSFAQQFSNSSLIGNPVGYYPVGNAPVAGPAYTFAAGVVHFLALSFNAAAAVTDPSGLNVIKKYVSAKAIVASIITKSITKSIGAMSARVLATSNTIRYRIFQFIAYLYK